MVIYNMSAEKSHQLHWFFEDDVYEEIVSNRRGKTEASGCVLDIYQMYETVEERDLS